MSLQIVGVENAGSIDTERVVFRVGGEPVAIWSYAVLDGANDDPDKCRHVYYFDDAGPFATLRAGDKVYLYTGKGENIVEHKFNRRVASYYWGLKDSLWKKGDKITLLLIEQRTDKVVE